MHPILVGRKPEQQILQMALESNESEMIAVIGRRRVGKTFLIQNYYKDDLVFQITGIYNATLKEQLTNFYTELLVIQEDELTMQKPTSWLEAFAQLIRYLKQKQQKAQGKMVIFLDELPWLATRRSGFLKALGFFWNSWAVRNNIVVVICGSAASWMIRHVIYHKGGLHNRVTQEINLAPFTLSETELFLKSRKVYLQRYQILQLYMVMGGIPHYLKKVMPGKSAIQNIEQICFSKNGLLRKEFNKLYASLFQQPEKYIAIIRALATKWKGLTRKEVLKISQLKDGGNVSKMLEELISSGFITKYYPFNKKKKQLLYRLTDEYSLFYLQFIENKLLNGHDIWQKLSQTSRFKSWCGFAFESLCWKHVSAIKKALGIQGIYTEVSSFVHRGNAEEQGTQIDLLIDRNDHVINICEAKFYNAPFKISKAYAQNLRSKMGIFSTITKTRKQIMFVLVTTFGLTPNIHSIGLVDNHFDMNIFFEE